MSQYMVEPHGRKDIRNLAMKFRRSLGDMDQLHFPIVKLLDFMTVYFPGFYYEIVEDDELPRNEHATTDIMTGHIRIKQSVYERACNGEGRDRMTIAHEIGHYFMLCYCGFALTRTYDNVKIPPFKDPEWQAKCFAGEFMIPKDRVGDMTAEEISACCGVSLEAARYQRKAYIKEAMAMDV